jgi:hypothetical protein
MTEKDPTELADSHQREADELEQRSERLAGEVEDTRSDWRRKRTDESIPGAPPPDHDISNARPEDEGSADESPASEAPPPEEGPSGSETASEGAAGPPSDTGDEGQDDTGDE